MSKKCKKGTCNFVYIKTHNVDFSDRDGFSGQLNRHRYKCSVCNRKKTITEREYNLFAGGKE